MNLTVRWPAAIVALVLGGFITGAAAQDSAADPVKAAFVFNFIKLTSWPETRFADDKAPLRLCTLDSDPAQALLQPLAGKRVGNHAIAVQTVADTAQAEDCHAFYLSAALEPRYPALLTQLAGKGILVVDEGSRFSWPNGMIRLFVEAGHVRFELNLDAVEKSKLKIDPRLIRLARIASR